MPWVGLQFVIVVFPILTCSFDTTSASVFQELVSVPLESRINYNKAEPRSAVGNVSDCRARGHEFEPGPVPYFRGDCS